MGQEPPTKRNNDATGEEQNRQGDLTNDETILGAPSPTHDDEQPAFQLQSNVRRIGRYELREEIGRGGFGKVYRAIQVEPVRRQVAIKLLKAGTDSASIARRFRTEQQLLALMNHNGIARVFDVDTTADGTIFFVMELIQGISIADFCDTNRLSIEQRIKLFIDVCHAIQHAHEKGIIHRDIKPSNVMVGRQDNENVVKIIDFGIAKAMQSVTLQDAETRTNELLGTPRYMSPEQTGMPGLTVDHRTDVYSLGVLLFELLVGEPPFAKELQTAESPIAWLSVIREREVMPPSSAIRMQGTRQTATARNESDAERLAKKLTDDLDWIVLKCLEKDPHLRYASVSELADDLQRYLKHLPIQARRPGLIYKLRKQIRRNQTVFKLSAVFAILLTTVISFSIWRLKDSQHVVSRLEDLTHITELISRHGALVNLPLKDRRTHMLAWMSEADDLLTRKDLADKALAELGNSELSDGPVMSSTDSALDTTLTQSKAELLVREFENLASSDGPRAAVVGWLQRTPSDTQLAERWQLADETLRTEYNGLVLEYREGLCPIGKNPQSGLYEFVDHRHGLLPEIRNGEYRPDAVTGIIYVLIPGGRFLMGSPASEPGRKRDEDLHEVTLSPYLISKYEITQGNWARIHSVVAGDTAAFDMPVCGISWAEAESFCKTAECFLPTEAQWEFACRANSPLPYSGAHSMDDLGWHVDNSGSERHRIAEKQPNAFGLFDMHGNAIEWCRDVYSNDFYLQPEATVPDPINEGLAPGTLKEKRVLRGGGFDGQVNYCRSADRYAEYPSPENGHRTFGVRPARPIHPPEPSTAATTDRL
ncbi:MAG: protein kinase [Planctomycetaceae bacterium]|nr:protein kinase [Planctomycetaceae bacterium]